MIGAIKRTLSFLLEDDAAAATEYAVVLALIVVATVGAISGVGKKVDNVVTNLNSGLGNITVRR